MIARAQSITGRLRATSVQRVRGRRGRPIIRSGGGGERCRYVRTPVRAERTRVRDRIHGVRYARELPASRRAGAHTVTRRRYRRNRRTRSRATWKRSGLPVSASEARWVSVSVQRRGVWTLWHMRRVAFFNRLWPDSCMYGPFASVEREESQPDTLRLNASKAGIVCRGTRDERSGDDWSWAFSRYQSRDGFGIIRGEIPSRFESNLNRARYRLILDPRIF